MNGGRIYREVSEDILLLHYERSRVMLLASIMRTYCVYSIAS